MGMNPCRPKQKPGEPVEERPPQMVVVRRCCQMFRWRVCAGKDCCVPWGPKEFFVEKTCVASICSIMGTQVRELSSGVWGGFSSPVLPRSTPVFPGQDRSLSTLLHTLSELTIGWDCVSTICCPTVACACVENHLPILPKALFIIHYTYTYEKASFKGGNGFLQEPTPLNLGGVSAPAIADIMV